MHQNPYWLAFLSCISLGVFIYTSYAGIQLYHYSRLNQPIPLVHIQWSILPFTEEEFAPQANYQFLLQGISYQGKTIWPEHYLNQWAAQKAIEKLAAQSWNAWIDPQNPHNSTLQKKFPLKQCLSTIVLWLLMIYFIGLGYYTPSN